MLEIIIIRGIILIREVLDMERFIDRESELETLQSEYARNGSALVVLYGQSGKNHAYF